MKDSLKNKAWIESILLCVILYVLFLYMYRAPLFVMNDDVAIEGILSGAYSGTPDLHTVYMGAGISFILSLMYRLIPVIPWFGLFCLAVIVFSSAVIMKKDKAAGLAFIVMFFAGCALMPHYTVVAAAAGGSGLFMLTGSDKEEKVGDIWAALIMLLLCYQIRRQVFYMFVPFLVPVLISRFIKERKEDKQQGKFIPVAACAAVFLLLFLIQHIAYRGEDWQEYLKLNDARTELYDYTNVWESEAAREYYRSLGVSDAAFPIYKNYDLIADTEADASRFHEMAAYREEGRQSEGIQRIKEALYTVKVSFIPGLKDPGMPYAYIFWIMTAAVLVLSIIEKDIRGLLAAGACAGLHLCLYAYLAYRGRMPERVVTALYIADISVMCGLLLSRRGEKLKKAALIVLAAVSIAGLAFTVKDFIDVGDYETQLAVNEDDDVLYSYMAEHGDELFLLETYATVNRTKYVLSAKKSEPFNCLLMGGWLYGSPLQKEKLKAFGYESAAEAIELGRGVNFACRYEVGLSPEQLQDFLTERYDSVILTQREILEGKREYFEIYTPARYK